MTIILSRLLSTAQLFTLEWALNQLGFVWPANNPRAYLLLLMGPYILPLQKIPLEFYGYARSPYRLVSILGKIYCNFSEDYVFIRDKVYQKTPEIHLPKNTVNLKFLEKSWRKFETTIL